jgi:hypothetical protein
MQQNSLGERLAAIWCVFDSELLFLCGPFLQNWSFGVSLFSSPVRVDCFRWYPAVVVTEQVVVDPAWSDLYKRFFRGEMLNSPQLLKRGMLGSIQ